jgi:hypothetical protein
MIPNNTRERRMFDKFLYEVDNVDINISTSYTQKLEAGEKS